MSSYEEKHDQALLNAPWLSQSSGSSAWLFKYAHHPDRAGYVFLATDLCGIYFESLTAPSVPARLSEIASMTTYGTNSSSALRSDSQRDVRSVMTQAGDTLDRLDEIMRPGSGMEGLVLEVQDHDFHDKLFVIRSWDFTWSFNTTDLKSRQPLTTIGKHLISPLSQLLLNSSHISPPRRSSPTDLAAAAINALGPMPTSSSAQAGPSKSSESRPPARPDVVKDSFEMPHETTQDDEEYGSDEDIVPSAAGGHASSSNLDVVNRASPSEQEKRSVSPVKGSPAPNTTRPLGKRKGRSDESQGDFPTPTPNAPTQDTQNSPVKPRNKTADAGSASSPVKPAAPSQSSQKTKKEKEREEEEAWEKRREEMKRKMQTGTAGGTKLGRRRLAR